MYADSGATQHMTFNKLFLTYFVTTGPERWSVSKIGEASQSVAGQGDVVLTATVNGERLHRTMRGVLYAPGLGINLSSIGATTDAGLKAVFTDENVSFSQEDVVIKEGKNIISKSKQKNTNLQFRGHCLLLKFKLSLYGINV
jgi:hypothetical protein